MYTIQLTQEERKELLGCLKRREYFIEEFGGLTYEEMREITVRIINKCLNSKFED